MIASGIAVIVLGAVTTCLTFMYRSMEMASHASQSTALQATAMDSIVRDIRSARGVRIDNDGARIQLLLPREYEERAGSYSNPTSAGSGEISFQGGDVVVTYLSINGELRRFNNIGEIKSIVPLSHGLDISFSPPQMTQAGSDVLPITVTVQTIPSARLYSRPRDALAAATNSITLAPNIKCKIFESQ